MLQNKQSNTKVFIIQYDDGGCVICISNKVEYLDKEFEWSDVQNSIQRCFILGFLFQYAVNLSGGYTLLE